MSFFRSIYAIIRFAYDLYVCPLPPYEKVRTLWNACQIQVFPTKYPHSDTAMLYLTKVAMGQNTLPVDSTDHYSFVRKILTRFNAVLRARRLEPHPTVLGKKPIRSRASAEDWVRQIFLKCPKKKVIGIRTLVDIAGSSPPERTL